MSRKQLRKNQRAYCIFKQTNLDAMVRDYSRIIRGCPHISYTPMKTELARRARWLKTPLPPQLDALVQLWTGRLGRYVNPLEAMLIHCFTNDLNTSEIYRHSTSMSSGQVHPNGWLNGSGEIHAVIRASVVRGFDHYIETRADSDHLPSDWRDDYDMVADEDGDVSMTDETFYCDKCEVHHRHSTTQSLDVVVSLHSRNNYDTETWCESAVENHAFYCNQSNRSYSDRCFSADETTGGETVCHDYMCCTDWHRNDDGEWSEYPEDDSRVPDYHDGNRTATRNILATMALNQSLPTRGLRYFGLEVEVEFTGGSDDRAEFYESNGLGNGTSHCAEKDGSLCDECGLEIISIPMTFESWQAGNSFTQLLADAKDRGATGWEHRSGYGCHVNMDLRGTTDFERKLFYSAVHNMDGLYKLVGGRTVSYYNCKPEQGATRSDDTIAKVTGRVVGDWDSKHQAVRMNSTNTNPMCEVRAFGSNLRPGAVVEYIELCSATLEWVLHLNKAPLDGEAVPLFNIFQVDPHKPFIAWLAKRASVYPRITALLARCGDMNVASDELARRTR